MTKVIYEVVQSEGSSIADLDEWQVEGIDYDKEGIIYSALFYGPEAKDRAQEYAHWMNTESAFDLTLTSDRTASACSVWAHHL